jgi:hypothetical protein
MMKIGEAMKTANDNAQANTTTHDQTPPQDGAKPEEPKA